MSKLDKWFQELFRFLGLLSRNVILKIIELKFTSFLKVLTFSKKSDIVAAQFSYTEER